jgi:ribosomal protein S18 acetylase RimI-like enzyme
MLEITNMKISIRSIRVEDLEFCTSLAKSVGWISQDKVVFEIFREKDPEGCFLAEDGGEPIGIIIATSYGQAGYLGTLIVKETHRGRGIGCELLTRGVQYLQSKGVQSIYLDAAPKAVLLYLRNGFKLVCSTLRFDGPCNPQMHPKVRQMTSDDLPEIFQLDKTAFGADRSYFLQKRFQYWPNACLVYKEGNEIAGFVTGRNFLGGVSVGPWIVTEKVEDPMSMLHALVITSGESILHMSILESNVPVVKLLRDSGFKERDDTHMRMAFGKAGILGQSTYCYAIGALSKG